MYKGSFRLSVVPCQQHSALAAQTSVYACHVDSGMPEHAGSALISASWGRQMPNSQLPSPPL